MPNFHFITRDSKKIPLEHAGIFNFLSTSWLSSFLYQTYRRGV